MNFSEIWDTPGYFYAVGYALCNIMVIRFQRPVLNTWQRWAMRVGLSAFLVAYMTLTMGARDGYFVAVMLGVVAVMYFSMLITIRDPVRTAFYCAKAFIYGEFASSLCWLTYYNLAIRWAPLQARRWELAIMTASFAVIAVGLYFIERTLHAQHTDPEISARDLIIVLLTAFSVYIVSNLGYIDRDGPFSGSFARDIFAMRTLADMCGAALIYAFHSQLIEVQQRLEKEALHNVMQLQYQAYRISRESIDMVNEKYHDLKHQIVLLRAQANSPKSEEYLDRMEQEIQNYEARNNTGNPVLDALLTNKGLYCRNRGIELKFIADGKLLDFMDDMDISALFGNMLDNAIESAERLDDPEKRLVRLYVAGEKQFLRIRMENYCEERVRFQDGLPVTTKRDRRMHGFGMKSMQRTVAKYGGSLLASQNGNWFELKILIPMGGE